MNVAVLCFHKLGGSSVVAGEIARELARRGHRFHFVGPSLPARLDPPPPGIEHHLVPLEQPAPVNGMGYAVALAVKLIEISIAHELDLIHAHYANPHAMAAQLAMRALGPRAPKLLLTLHGSDVPLAETPDSARLLLRRAVLDAAAVTTPSRALAEQAKKGLLMADLPEVIPNFADPKLFQPDAGHSRAVLAPLFAGARDWDATRVLCHASNFRPVKRALDVVAAFARVRKARQAVLVFAGEGPDLPRAQEAVAAAGLSRDVAFAGPQRELAPLLRACDLFLMPSVTESFGLAALEAMSCGAPVIASRAGGLPEVIADGESGLLVQVGSVDELAAAALRLCNDDQERARLSRGARERALLFQPSAIVPKWEALYERLALGSGL